MKKLNAYLNTLFRIMPYPTSFMPDLNAMDYLLHARGLLCSWLGELSSLQTKNIVCDVREHAQASWLRILR